MPCTSTKTPLRWWQEEYPHHQGYLICRACAQPSAWVGPDGKAFCEDCWAVYHRMFWQGEE